MALTGHKPCLFRLCLYVYHYTQSTGLTCIDNYNNLYYNGKETLVMSYILLRILNGEFQQHNNDLIETI